MNTFAIGDTVQVTGPIMTGSVGTVTYIDEQRGTYLVVVSSVTQNYFAPEELVKFKA